MEEVAAAAVVSETRKCCLAELWKCCLAKCMRGDSDEADADYHVEDNSVQYNLHCCTFVRTVDGTEFHYVPSLRNSENRNSQYSSKTVKQGVALGKLETCL